MKKIIYILFVIHSSILFGQKIDSTKTKQIEMYEKIMYGMNSTIFKKQNYYSKLDKNYQFPWKIKKYTTDQLVKSLDTLVQNSTVEIKQGSFSNLILEFNSYFPTYIDSELSETFKLTIKNNQIKNLNSEIIKIDTDGSTGYGSKFLSGFENEKSYSYNWITINKSFNIRSEVKKENLKGKVLFNAGFVTDYDYLKINKSQIGKTLRINELEFTVIDFFENKIILDFKQNIDDLKFSFVNIDNKGNRIIQIPYLNLQQLKEKGTIPTDAVNLPEGSQTLNKTEFDLFKSNPNITFIDYQKIVHEKFVKILNSKKQKETAKQVWGKKYIMFSATDKLINFYLYMPKYIEKDFEIRIE